MTWTMIFNAALATFYQQHADEPHTNECRHLALVGPPRLLGRLRKRLPDTVARCVVESISGGV